MVYTLYGYDSNCRATALWMFLILEQGEDVMSNTTYQGTMVCEETDQCC